MDAVDARGLLRIDRLQQRQLGFADHRRSNHGRFKFDHGATDNNDNEHTTDLGHDAGRDRTLDRAAAAGARLRAAGGGRGCGLMLRCARR